MIATESTEAMGMTCGSTVDISCLTGGGETWGAWRWLMMKQQTGLCTYGKPENWLWKAVNVV